uniref:Uncharacterized protein n=1 Tax=Ostreococcus mediterraneus TaxID=1486918 RepID=A0A6U0BKN5_9CHLO|mmetsp:Transcript_1956/g.7297  ORF Transcript_1956/g.7297 Transcript_1956/m.7297 type:complete len:227 (-) Transcript_1956:9-689(-)|eukprot:CAMPEP_0174585228 /NCGR_PEP_ID=MMETSP0929-20130131/20577_1 /TAXON_ID=548131 ORGANISM="Ostreococcus mediterraneus, Strain clade-D-RCC2572" /NCGR_SAMPLE_ID=MMETSP0929 /ASSEMBLY_ACC=CAM_ASM_000573 /LENGTH=226 /DNA_ID=CAMNT_0015767179 /DNA_START=111 /DNA_END=787 /DNA_ORIENTATION=-
MNDGAEMYGGTDVLRAAAATPLTPEIATKTSNAPLVAREDDGNAHTIANLCSVDKAKIAKLVDKCLESHFKVEALERRVAAAERALEIERQLRGDVERDRDEAVERARVLGEQLAASRDKVVAAAATARKFQNKLKETRRVVGLGDAVLSVDMMIDEFEVPIPRQGLEMTPTPTRRRAQRDSVSNDGSRGEAADESMSAEFGIGLAHLVASVERVNAATGRRLDSP